MQRDHHPVWPLYDEIRTARLNKKVLGLEICRLASRILWTEIVIGITTSSSIGGLWFLQTIWGAWLWKLLGVVAVVIMVLKPILKYQDEKEAKEALLIGYSLFEDQLSDISREIQTRQVYDDGLKEFFRRAMQKKKDLIESGVNSRITREEIDALQNEVEQELPGDRFYLPPI